MVEPASAPREPSVETRVRERRVRERRRAPAEVTGSALTSALAAWGPLPLRLMLGFGFLYHGVPKVFTAEGHESFVQLLSGSGVPWPTFTAWAVGLLEVLGGAALFLGAFTWIVAILLIAEMIVAIVLVHFPHGFAFLNVVGTTPEGPVFGMPGYEVNLLYIAGLLSLLLTGAGAASLDAWWIGRRRSAAGRGAMDEGSATGDGSVTGHARVTGNGAPTTTPRSRRRR